MTITITKDESRFLRLFASNELTHTKRTRVAAAAGDKGKREADYYTVAEPVGLAEVRKHFAGKVSIVAKPVRLDKRCYWGAIDIDVYDSETFAAIEAAAAELPLNILRSKSGGLHLFAFFDPPQFAAEVRGQLADWGAQLGYPGAEIFPAQDQIDDGNLGLGIALPFFGDAEGFAKFTPQYYSLNGTAPKEAPASNTQPLGIAIPPGVSFRDALATKLNFKTVTRNGRVVYQYHGLPAFQGGKQPCLVQETVHQSHANYAGECAFIEQNGRFFHTCYDSDCRAKGTSVRGAEEVEPGDTISVTRLVIQKLGLENVLLNATRTAPQDDWPEPAILGEDLPAVEPFELALLPASLRDLVEDVSERMQTPPDFAGASAVVALAGCVGRRAWIQPKAEDTTWAVTPNLWGALVAPPGFMKSPTLRALTAPHAHIEEVWRAEHESSVVDFESEKEKAELHWQVWREEFKRAQKKNASPPVQPDRSLSQPAQRRLVLTDATFEKLHEILSENPAGVLVVRDELTGWLSSLDRQGREGERGFYLQAWNGDAGFTIDRIGRGSVYVPAVCISLLGCIQPARLRWYLSQTLEGGPSDDGLLQRFQIAVWPDQPREWKLVDRLPNNTALAGAEKIFSILANLSADAPVKLCFDPEAQQLFFAWWRELETKVRGEAGLHPAAVAHLAKYRSLMPSLAGLFELADAVTENREFRDIGLVLAQQAAALCAYLELHAKRIYSCITAPELHAARELAKHIERGELKQTFTTREAYGSHWSGLDTPERARLALEVLEDANWVRAVKTKSTGGRPPETWQINPKVVARAK